LAASVGSLQSRLEAVRRSGGCLLSIGLGAGFLSKSAGIAGPDADYRKLLGLLPFYQRAIQTGLPFPKTRRIVFLKNKPASLAGWVELGVSE
jgi:CRISPR-associated protein Csm5